MNALAEQLNKIIQHENSFIYEMLSNLGKELYEPKGILSQSAEAGKKAYRFNATIGIATEQQEPMHFEHIQKQLNSYAPKDIYPYAPPSGKPSLRKIWKKKLLMENPSMRSGHMGLPIVTNALTHGLSITADLFADTGDTVIVPDKYWGNYQSIFTLRRGAQLTTFPLFNEENHFHADALKAALLQQKEAGKAIVLLNFPNNPTGYTPSEKEMNDIAAVLEEAAQEGVNIVAVLDDAYFGLFYEDSSQESLFGKLAGRHPRILPVKIDGATKENYVWGLRVGFITYGSSNSLLLEALEKKTNGIIRGTISSGSHLSQTIILNSLQSKEFIREKQEKFKLMKRRANKVKELLSQEEPSPYWSYYPFNSGYFMCLQLKEVNAEQLRLHLLDEYGVGVVAINPTDLRIAFSCVEEQDIEELFTFIFKGINDLTKLAFAGKE